MQINIAIFVSAVPQIINETNKVYTLKYNPLVPFGI